MTENSGALNNSNFDGNTTLLECEDIYMLISYQLLTNVLKTIKLRKVHY